MEGNSKKCVAFFVPVNMQNMGGIEIWVRELHYPKEAKWINSCKGMCTIELLCSLHNPKDVQAGFTLL